MSSGTPVAVINGIEKFGAAKLAEKLKLNDIEVIGIGEFTGKLEDLVKRAEYYFDFESDVTFWEKAEVDRAKLVVVGVNRSVVVGEELRSKQVNWRVINIHGAYGPEMEKVVTDATASQEEVGYLIEAVKLAVANKNLILPSRKAELRLMTEDDMTEVIMRSCFLSGTEGEVFEIWGEQVSSEELAKVLIDEAKMTRFKVEENDQLHGVNYELDRIKVESDWKKLRWKPIDNWAGAMKETMQAYFMMADEESRKPKRITNDKLLITNEKAVIENKRRFEVQVEEDNEELIINDEELKKDLEIEPESNEQVKSLEEIIKSAYTEVPSDEGRTEIIEEEEELIEKEEMEEIKPILVKNSNMRLVKDNEELPIDKYEFEKAIKTEPKPIVIEEKKVEIKKEVKVIRSGKKINWMRWGWRGMMTIWGIMILALIIWVINVSVMFGNFSRIKKLMTERKYDEASQLIQKTKTLVIKQENGIEDWGWNRLVWGRRYQETLKVMEQGVVLADKALALSKRSELMGQAVFEDKDIDWNKEMAGLKNDLSETEDALGAVGARLSGDWRWVPARWRGNLTDLSQTLRVAREQSSLAIKMTDILPEILGTDGKRREFMVLLQNENELRPTGGFIGSYGIISFEGGKLINFEIEDVYQADGQLKGHVEPPQPIKDYLGEGGWFMRDANWQADFPGAAKDIQWFLEKETGRKVDGVIGINLAVAKSILGVLGEVYVPDFKEKINKNNLYEQAEFYSETNSFAGSDQKASFLGGLGKQLFESIKSMKGEKKLELAKALMDSLERNEMVMSMNNAKAAGTVGDLGWNGSVYQGKCPSPTSGQLCFADYLYIVEANLGVNKANYFLYRNVDETIDISNHSVGRTVRITYENTAKSLNWPGGDYKNYMRVYIPKTANVAEVSVSDPAAAGQKTVFNGDNLKINNVLDKKEVGFLVTVPIGQKRVVEMRYVDQIEVTTKDKFSYINFIQKQPGFGDTGLVVLATMPEGWQVNQVEPNATLVNGKLLFNQKLEKNIKMGIEIIKN